VATEDTVTQLRAVIRKLLAALDQEASPLAGVVRAALVRDDDYVTLDKPPCDWDDREAREALVAGQDVAMGDDGVFRIVRGVAKDRVISTVDVEARYDHKSKNRHFDGYKAHLSIDPDSELICEIVATPANTHDAKAVSDLLEHEPEDDKPIVLGDCVYADGATRMALGEKGFVLMAKCPPIRNATGGFTKDRFVIDLDTNTVTCPAGKVATITRRRDHRGVGRFAPHCGTCPLRAACTRSRAGRQVAINTHESILQKARAEQTDPEWVATYRANRPLVEAKIAHLVRRGWGGRRGRTRGLKRIATDLDTRASAINWARLAALGLSLGPTGWIFTNS